MGTQKRSRGRRPDNQVVDRHLHPRRAFHAPAELFDALGEYVKATKPQTTEAAVIRDALGEYLERKGFPVGG